MCEERLQFSLSENVKTNVLWGTTVKDTVVLRPWGEQITESSGELKVTVKEQKEDERYEKILTYLQYYIRFVFCYCCLFVRVTQIAKYIQLLLAISLEINFLVLHLVFSHEESFGFNFFLISLLC